MCARRFTLGLNWLLLFHYFTCIIACVTTTHAAESLEQEGDVIHRQEFEQFRSEINEKVDLVIESVDQLQSWAETLVGQSVERIEDAAQGLSVGLPGPRDEPVIPGAKGDRGFSGPTGPPSTVGPQGPPGQPGPQGQKGMKGVRGLRGLPGLPGPQGPKGETGPRGLPGSRANVGPVVDELEKLKTMMANFLGQKDLNSTPCGGYIHVNGSSDLIYQAPPNGILHGCAWVVAARTTGPLKVRLVPDAGGKFNSNFKLQIVYSPNATSVIKEDITSTTLGELTFLVQFVIVFFVGQTYVTGQGFRLNISDSGSIPSQTWATFVRKNDSFSMRYPPAPLSKYADNQAFFILGSPPTGKKFNVSVTDVDIEADYDWVTYMGLEDRTGDDPLSYFSRSGRGSSPGHAELKKNMPFVLYFRSDGSVGGTGFAINVS